MGDSIEYRVDLDTKGAKKDLKKLNKKAAETKRKVAFSALRGIPSKLGLGVGAVGGHMLVTRLGSKFRGAKVDMFETAMLPIMAAVQQFADEKIGYSVKARQRALSDTKQQMAMNTYFLGNTNAAKSFYDTRVGITTLQEEGRNILRQTLKGPTLAEVMLQATSGYINLFGEAFDYIFGELTD